MPATASLGTRSAVDDELTLTSCDSVRVHLENAGAYWVDREVVVNDGLITCRTPDDHPAFNRKMIEQFARTRRETRGTKT